MKKIIISITVIVSLIVVLFFWHVYAIYYKAEDLNIPHDTKIMVQFSTDYNKKSFANMPHSTIMYYDNDGKHLKTDYFTSEIKHQYLKEIDNEKTIFVSDVDYLWQTNNKYVKLESTNEEKGTVINKIIPIQDRKEYIVISNDNISENFNTFVRVVSKDNFYTINIKEKLLDVCYDKFDNKLYMFIDDNLEINNHILRYYIFDYNQNTKKYEKLDLKAVDLNSKKINTNYSFQNFMVKKSKIYMTFLANFNNDIMTVDLGILTINGDKVLIKFIEKDLKRKSNGKILLDKQLYVPNITLDDKIYIFTLDNLVYIINDEKNIKKIDMLYSFEGSKDINNLLKSNYGKNDFNGSFIKIKNNEIYVLNVFDDNKIYIRKLKEDGTYETIFSTMYSIDFRKNEKIVNFSIIDN